MEIVVCIAMYLVMVLTGGFVIAPYLSAKNLIRADTKYQIQNIVLFVTLWPIFGPVFMLHIIFTRLIYRHAIKLFKNMEIYFKQPQPEKSLPLIDEGKSTYRHVEFKKE